MNVLFLAFSVLHAFHVSICEIEISDQGSLEMVMTIFADDLEVAVNTWSKQDKMDIFNDKSYGQQRDLINAYILDHTSLQLDKQNIRLTYIGHELQENRCLIYFEGQIKKEGVITIINHSLMDVFSDQQNIMRITSNKKQQTFLFHTIQDSKEYLLDGE